MNGTNNQNEILQKIDAYLNREMTREEQDLFWEFLIENPQYHDQLQLQANLRAAISEGASASKPYGESDNPPDMVESAPVHYLSAYRNWIMAAAAVLVLVVGFNLFKVTSPEGPSLALLDDLIRVDNIDLFELESIAATRGEHTGETTELVQLFDRGLMAAIEGDLQAALDIYREIIRKFPDQNWAAKAALNAGILLYNDAKYDESIRFFALSVERSGDDILTEKAWWYKGHAEINVEDYANARHSMFMAFGMDGVYKREALRQLRVLDAFLGYVDFDDIDPYEIDP